MAPHLSFMCCFVFLAYAKFDLLFANQNSLSVEWYKTRPQEMQISFYTNKHHFCTNHISHQWRNKCVKVFDYNSIILISVPRMEIHWSIVCPQSVYMQFGLSRRGISDLRSHISNRCGSNILLACKGALNCGHMFQTLRQKIPAKGLSTTIKSYDKNLSKQGADIT